MAEPAREIDPPENLPTPPTLGVIHRALGLPFDRAGYDLAGLKADIAGIDILDDPVSLKRRARDYHWFSPIVRASLEGRTADLVVLPRTIDEVMRLAAAAARRLIPVTIRGAGTGTYGQAVPLYGGVVLDMSRMNRILEVTPDRVVAEPGAILFAVEAAAREIGRELRMHPSTKRTATIGGYFSGGSGGIGSVAWGGLREPGNMGGARVVTLEAEPRLITLDGVETNLVNRTFGTTGIVVEVTAPLAPAHAWRDVVVSFPDIEDAIRFGYAVSAEERITKRLVTVLDRTCAGFLDQPLGDVLKPGEAIVLTMLAPDSVPAARALAADHRGAVTLDDDALAREADPKRTPLYECAWGHTTLHAIRREPTMSYLQALYPPGRTVETAIAMARRFGAELPLHMEFIRYEGEVAANGAQLWPFTSVERLEEIIAVHEAAGVPIANPHVFTVEDGSRHKRVPGDQLGFKTRVDPSSLLNPGKFMTRSA